MSELNKEVLDLVWGRPSSGGVSASIFRRWTQGNYVFLYYGCQDIWGYLGFSFCTGWKSLLRLLFTNAKIIPNAQMQCIHALANGNEYALVLVIVLILLTCCLSFYFMAKDLFLVRMSTQRWSSLKEDPVPSSHLSRYSRILRDVVCSRS